MDLVFAATVAVVLGGYSVFKMVYFGSLLPNTYYAKIVGRAAAWHRPLGRHYLLCFLRFHPFDVLLPLAGTVLILRAKRYSYLFALALLFTIVFVAWFSNGDWMPTFRFMLPFLVISVPIYFAASQAGATTGRSKALSAVFSICLLTSPIHAFRLETVLPFRPDDCVKKSQYLRRMNPLSSIGEGFPAPFVWQSMWLAQNCLPDAVIAIPDIGFIGYSTDLEVMDFVGLTDADMTRIVAGPNRNRDFLEYFHLRRPDIVFLHRAKLSYTPEDDDHTASEYWGRLLMGDHEFLANYECVETRNVGSIRGYLHIYRRKDYVGPPSKPNWAFLDQVLKRARLVPNVQCEYAYLLQQSGKSEEYHNHVNMLTKRFPSNAWALLLGARAARQRGELEKSLNLYWRTYRHAEGVTREKALREMEVVYRRAGKPAGKVGRLLEAMKASAQ